MDSGSAWEKGERRKEGRSRRELSTLNVQHSTLKFGVSGGNPSEKMF